MQRAPWAKTSTSAPQPRHTAAMSSRLHSRASTTRSQPSSRSTRAPPVVNRLIWVLA